MIRSALALAAILVISMLALAQSSNKIVLYEGARIIPGDGGRAIENAAMLVEDGVITIAAWLKVGKSLAGGIRAWVANSNTPPSL